MAPDPAPLHTRVEHKLQQLLAHVGELRDLVEPAEVFDDLLAERFASFTLVLAVQCVIDVVDHVVRDPALPADDHPARIARLADGGWIPQELVARLDEAVDLRDRLLHRDTHVDNRVIVDFLLHRLPDFDRFAVAVRAKLRAGG